MGRLMGEDETDAVTGLTAEEMRRLADQAYEQRDEDGAWEDEEPAEVAPEARSVVSVRFNRGELARVEQAAREAGMPVSTFIRSVALRAVTEEDGPAAQGRVAELVRHMQKDLAALARQLRFTA
jgi:predicted DNA binding CopG/RHH family protein